MKLILEMNKSTSLTDKDYAAIEQVLRKGAFKSFDNWVVGVGKGIRY